MASDRKPKGKPKGGARAEAARRNGARGGRPRERRDGSGISWTIVRQRARLGADRELIVRSMGIRDKLKSPGVLERLQEEVDRGEALHQIDLLEDVQRIRAGGPGKVNAVLASLKQSLGWNRVDSGKGNETTRPDASVAVAEIQRMLRRFGAAG